MLDDRAKYWTPVDHYIGGIEHAVMHLLYARFYHKLLRDVGLLNSDEPFSQLLTQGMVIKDGMKMSKSKGNTVDPQELINKYGADTVRLFIIFAAPPDQSLDWSDSGVEGSYRFLKRLWAFAYENSQIKAANALLKSGLPPTIDWDTVHPEQREARRKIYEILRQARYDYERLQLNTVVSGCMKLLNVLYEVPCPLPETEAIRNVILQEGVSILLRLLAPITPHITHCLWRELGYEGHIINAKWPKVVADALKTAQLSLVVQINGKLRGKISVPADADQASIQDAAINDPHIQHYLAGKPCKKVIVVPGKLVNLVV